MSKRWTRDEDILLLALRSIGADYIASHDLGRPHGSGSRRLKKLQDAGAIIPFLEMSIAQLKLEILCGRPGFDPEGEIKRLEDELDHEIAVAGSKA